MPFYSTNDNDVHKYVKRLSRKTGIAQGRLMDYFARVQMGLTNNSAEDKEIEEAINRIETEKN